VDAALVEIGKSIPIAGALIYLVILFLRSLDKRDDSLKQVQSDWSSSLNQTVSKSNECIDRNTNALIQTLGVIEKCKAKNEG
jgi:hypothetical protein